MKDYIKEEIKAEIEEETTTDLIETLRMFDNYAKKKRQYKKSKSTTRHRTDITM